MSNKKVAAVLAERRIAANDNTLPAIEPKDVAVADRGHRLGDLEKGRGFTGFEPHPYRSKARYRPHKKALGKWVRIPKGERVKARYANVVWPDKKPRPVADNDNTTQQQQTGRKPTKHERKTAGEGLPIEVEFKTGRIEGRLWETAADVRDCYEVANAPEVSARSYDPQSGNAITMDRRVRAVQTCQTLRYRTMHLWRPLIDACVFGKTMGDIGREYGGNKEDAAKLGRQKVIDATLLAREVLWDLRQFEREDSKAADSGEPLPQRKAYAIGRRAADLPDFINDAANQNMRSIDKVA